MTILAIDDEPVMLVHLETELRKVFPKADIVTFDECDEVLAFLETPQSRSLHYAFMDIKLRGMLGIELAKRIKDQCPQTRILFCTSYSYYALEAYQLHALGYLMKPVDADKLREAVSQIEAQLGTFPEDGTEIPGKLVVHTFGNFEVLYNGTPLVFEREKAKELLALLIDRQGLSMTNGEIEAFLWEELHSPQYLQTLFYSLRKTLRGIGFEDLLIRTPINGIRGMVEIGDHYSEDLAKQAECRRKIWDASTLLLELVNEVLDMGKLESGEILLESCPFNVIELKDGIRQTMERAAAERGITMTDRTEVKHTTLIGSPLHLKRLLMNILSNAIKYNKDNGSIDLTCREVRSDGKTAWIEFICADTGIGMSEEFQKHLYEPFTQEHSDARTSYNGTGLGMAITKSLVEKMGGTIECRSKLGEGTTYCITIPFAIDSSTAPRVEETAALPAATPEGMHVLLAEDNELNIEIAVFVLENAGVTVTKAVNGQDALDQFAASAPGTFDAIIMDVMMPVMDGYQATRAIRQLDRPDAGSIPILAMTANAFVEDRRRAYEAGMNEHLTKPLEPEVVLRTLAKYRSK